MVTIRKPYDEHERVQTSFIGVKGLTKQSMRDECDINKIVKQWDRDGAPIHTAANPPTYGDFDTSMEYQDAMNQLMVADQAFMALPSRTRARVDNDPAKLIDFLADPDNLDEARSLGLVQSEKEEEQIREGDIPDPTPPASPPETPPAG